MNNFENTMIAKKNMYGTQVLRVKEKQRANGEFDCK